MLCKRAKLLSRLTENRWAHTRRASSAFPGIGLGTKDFEPGIGHDQGIAKSGGTIEGAGGAGDLFTVGKGLIGKAQGGEDGWCFLLRPHGTEEGEGGIEQQ